jgi:hypothetical protein
MAKMTYAQIAEQLSKQYNKYDKNLQNAVTDAEKNSAMMMLQRVSGKLNQLMLANQAEANAADQKETPADSPNQSIGQRTMRMAKNGGSLKSIPKGKKGKGLSKLPKKVRNKMGYMKEGGSTFPDLTGDGKVTQADILKGRGVFGKGGNVSWKWGSGTYSGTLIPSMETSEARFARTHNGKIKRLPKKEEGGLLPIPPDNKGLPKLPKAVRNNMGYMQFGGPLDGGINYDESMGSPGMLAPMPPVEPKLNPTGKLYDGLTMEQIKEYLYEAGVISGLGDKFDPTNKEHVKKLQEGLLGGYTGPYADRMLSGNEPEFINREGKKSVNKAGIDGKFGIDTFTALQEFTKLNPIAVNQLTRLEPNMLGTEPTADVDLSALAKRPIMSRTDTGGEDGDEEPSVKNFLGNSAMKLLPGIAKYLEYNATANALNSMLPPPDLTLQRPRYINTDVDISQDLNALNDARLMRERALTDSSTKRNNVLQNLNAQDANFNRLRSKLFQDQRNKERQLENAQSVLNAQAEDENRKRIYDNAMNYRDFLNDQTRARRDFRSAVVGDVMDLQTQRTDRESQMARLNALMPYLNMYGVYDRSYAGADPTLLNLLGFNKSS